MKKSYISAMDKIIASSELRDKTLAAMHKASGGKSKLVSYKSWAAVAVACIALLFVAPAAVSMLNGRYGTEALTMHSDSNAAAPQNELADAPQAMRAQEEGAVPQAGLGVNGPVQKLSAQAAQEIAMNGAAFIENANEAGGYEPSGMQITSTNELRASDDSVYFELTVVLQSGAELVLIVK